MYQEDKSMLWNQFKWKSKQIDDVRGTNVYAINPEFKDA